MIFSSCLFLILDAYIIAVGSFKIYFSVSHVLCSLSFFLFFRDITKNYMSLFNMDIIVTITVAEYRHTAGQNFQFFFKKIRKFKFSLSYSDSAWKNAIKWVQTSLVLVQWFLSIKSARSYFSKFSFLFHLRNHHSKDINLKFQLNQSSCLDCNFIYCSYL